MAKVRTRKRGKTYSYIFEAGKKPNGTRKVVEKGGFPTQDDAYNAGVEAYTDWKHGNIGITSEQVAVTQFFQRWLDDVCAANVRPSTLEVYRLSIKNHIIPLLGKRKMQDLTPALLDNWIHALARRGYAKKTLTLTYRVLKEALDYAVYPATLIASNPAIYIKVPRSAPTNIIKRTIVSPQNFTNLLAKYSVGDSFRIVLQLFYRTGMRASELCGLTWDHVDLQAKTITINRQLQRDRRRHRLCMAKVKSTASNRTIYIDDTLTNELSAWHRQQIQNELKFGERYVCNYLQPDGGVVRMSKVFAQREKLLRLPLVCTRVNGAPYEMATVDAILKKHGLNSHSFRHTHATMLAESGASAKSISARLGHSSTSITENLYMHTTDEMSRQAADAFDDIFRRKMQTK